MPAKKKPPALTVQAERRKFLIGAGAGATITVASAGLGGTALEPVSGGITKWDVDTDVVVVGSGAAAGVAAAKALDAGARVVVVEKAPVWGGTTAKSGCWYWICNNSHMRKLGLQDPRDDAIRYMARMSYPAKYRPQAPHLGLLPREYELLQAFYDHGAEAIDELARMGAVQSEFVGGERPISYDYGALLPENRAPLGRGLLPKGGGAAPGVFFTGQLRKFIAGKGGQILLNHRATGLHTNAAGEVVGLRVRSADVEKSIRARRGVVFASGGFTHNEPFRNTFLRGPVFGGCAVPSNEGDFIPMATALGCDLGNMTNAWWGESALEDALKNPSFGQTLFIPAGKSMFYVNRFGRRVVDEIMPYNERTQIHFVWDSDRFEFPNRVLIMIFDQATRTENAGYYPIPPAGTKPSLLMQADTLAALSERIDARLKELSPQIGPVQLDGAFAANLAETERRFAAFAAAGKDDDFGRGTNLAGRMLVSGAFDPKSIFGAGAGDTGPKSAAADRSAATASNSQPLKQISGQQALDQLGFNDTMRPLAKTGPYYAILVCGGTLDTKGGPLINADAQVIDAGGRPIPGLYGAGNCIASPAGAAYHAPGGTIGMAVVFGYIAGAHAAKAPEKKA